MAACQFFYPLSICVVAEHLLKGGFLTLPHLGPPEPQHSQKHHLYRAVWFRYECWTLGKLISHVIYRNEGK